MLWVSQGKELKFSLGHLLRETVQDISAQIQILEIDKLCVCEREEHEGGTSSASAFAAICLMCSVVSREQASATANERSYSERKGVRERETERERDRETERDRQRERERERIHKPPQRDSKETAAWTSPILTRYAAELIGFACWSVLSTIWRMTWSSRSGEGTICLSK
jgi:cobalamin-dependent methionine synthase I